MKFKFVYLICISLFLLLPVTIQAENEPKKVEGVYLESVVVYTIEGKKIGKLKIADEEDIVGMHTVEKDSPRKLVGINFIDGDGKGEKILEDEANKEVKTKLPEDNILWFRASNLKLSIAELPPCPEVPARSASMERPIASGISCNPNP